MSQLESDEIDIYNSLCINSKKCINAEVNGNINSVYNTLNLNTDITQRDNCDNNNINISEVDIYDLLDVKPSSDIEDHCEGNDDSIAEIDIYDALNVDNEPGDPIGCSQYKYTISIYNVPSQSFACRKWNGPLFCMMNINGNIHISESGIYDLTIPLPCPTVNTAIQTVVYSYVRDNETQVNISLGYCKIYRENDASLLSIYNSTDNNNLFETFTTYNFDINIFI